MGCKNFGWQNREVVVPIYEYKCMNCYVIFELLVFTADLKKAPGVEVAAVCDECGSVGHRIVSGFSFNKIGPVSGIDDTDELTLGKLVQERGIPAEFKPTIAQIREREERKRKDKEYIDRVKEYKLEKPTEAELRAETKKVDIIRGT